MGRSLGSDVKVISLEEALIGMRLNSILSNMLENVLKY